MIIVNSAIMQDKIIDILEACKEASFKFIKKEGIRIYFETDMEDQEAAAKIAKAEIKKDPIGGTLLFSVKTEEYI